MKNCLVLVLLGTMLFACESGSVANAEIISRVLDPSQDNTIFSESTNSNALGSLYIGRTAQGGVRRALMQFDIAGNIPAGSIIHSVKLELNQTKLVDNAARNFDLHLVTKAWGEGTSFASPGAGGQGAAPTTGDATWSSAMFGNTLWTTLGGDFVSTTSGTTSIGTGGGFFAFNSQSGMLSDVQSWLSTPGSNFGWLVKMTDENVSGSAREFSSKNIAPAPKLTIDFTAIPEPSSTLLLVVAATIASRLRLSRRHTNARTLKTQTNPKNIDACR